jgi:hypothetical protein
VGRAIVSPRLRREPFAADHTRARELAAQRVDGPIAPDDAGWLNDHLAWCGPCRAVAVEYDEQRLALRALRFDEPVPPRDLWARTAARIEMEPSRRRPASRRRRTGFGTYASLTGALIVALVTGTVLIDRVLPPLDNTTKGDEPIPTPIDLLAGEIQVLSHAADGSLEIQSKYLDQLCPVGAETCGLPDTVDVTNLGSLGAAGQLDAIVSPDRGQLVVVERGSSASTVYVLPLKHTGTAEDPTPHVAASTGIAAATPTMEPTETAATSPDESGSPDTTEPAATASAEVTEAPSDTASGSPDASSGPDTSGEPATEAPATDEPASAEPTDATASSEAATTEPTPVATPDETAEATEPPPSIAVTPRPGGAIEIASDVVIVGSAAGYSPDGSRFAFSARPADGSAGPDVYVWHVGDRKAKAVTAEHDAQLAGWIGERLLVSRVVDGEPSTAILDLADDTERLVGDGPMWRPTMGPERNVAAWWDGTVRRADDGTTWVPDRGQLILGDWPGGAADAQVLAGRGITDWDIQWDEDGTRLAVWVSRDGPDEAGQLSLYDVDPATGRADLDHPTLDKAPAFAGFALHPGRLAWSAPADGGDTTVKIMAWDGTSVGTVSLPADDDTTILR